MGDFVLGAEVSYPSAGEVCSIVGYNCLREIKATYEVLP